MKSTNTLIRALAVFVISLCSCEDDELVPPSPPLTTVRSSGTINISEIGGTNLTVQSYFKENSTVSNGQYVTDVSTKGTQLLFVTDGARQVRGLTLSTLSSGNPRIIECNALSTAYALLFLTPGVCTSRPDFTTTRMNMINQLNSFSQLVAHLRSNLPNNSLNVLITSQQTQTLLRNCINEFIAADTSSLLSKRNMSEVLSDPNFIASRTTSTQVKLTNYNWRCVNALRRDIRFDGVEKLPIQTISSDMGGGVPYSLGTVFAWIREGFQPFPTILDDGTTIPGDATKSEYWAIGPGKALGDIPPQSVTQRMNLIQPYTSTILFYILFPVIDIVTGGSMFGDVNLGQILTATRKAADDMKDITDVVNAVTGVINAPDDVLATSEALATAVEVVFVGFVSNPIFYKGILTSAQAALLLKVYGFAIGVTSAANVTIVAILYHITPTFSKYTVESWIPVLMSPQNGYVTSTLTPTLSSYPVLGATNYKFQIAQTSTFANLAVDANSSSSQYRVLQGVLASNQQYYWRVNATVSNQASQWSEVRNFSTSGGGGLRNIYLLVRSSTDLTVDYFENLLDSLLISYTRVSAADVPTTNFANSVIIAGFSSEPTEFQSVASTIGNAVSQGAYMITEAYGTYLLSYFGMGTVSPGYWGPAVLDKFAYVNKITDSPIFNGIPVWDPPLQPDRPAQFTHFLTGTASIVNANYRPPQNAVIDTLKYWMLVMYYGWPHAPTNSQYCQNWGGCTPERTVYLVSCNIIHHGAGRIFLSNGSPVTNQHLYGPVTKMFHNNFIAWAMNQSIDDRLRSSQQSNSKATGGGTHSLLLNLGSRQQSHSK